MPKYVVGIITCFVVVFGNTSFSQAQADPMAAIRQLVDEVYNAGNIAAVDTIFAENYTRYPEATDRDSFKRIILGLRAAMPDFQAKAVILVNEGDAVALHLHMQGTLVNELIFPESFPIPPNSQNVTMVANIIYRFNEMGQIIEEWNGFDNLSFLAQVGAIPMPASIWNAPSDAVTVAAGATRDQNLLTIQSYFNALQNGDFASMQQALLDNFIAYNPFGSFDRGGFIDDWWALKNALPDLSLRVDSVIIQGDQVVVRYALQGTFAQNFVMADGVDEVQRIVEIREIYDGFSFLIQLGVMQEDQ
jgi:predicted ester cyclase